MKQVVFVGEALGDDSVKRQFRVVVNDAEYGGVEYEVQKSDAMGVLYWGNPVSPMALGVLQSVTKAALLDGAERIRVANSVARVKMDDVVEAANKLLGMLRNAITTTNIQAAADDLRIVIKLQEEERS